LCFIRFDKLNSLLALSILTILIATPSISAQPSVKPTETKPATEKTGIPVVLMDETLFLIYDKVGPFTPEDRAKAITERLAKLIKDPLSQLDSITTFQGETTTDILAGDMVIMSVTDRDAKAVGRARQELAEEYAQIIRDSVEEIIKYTSVKSILIGIVLSLAITGVLIFIISLSQRFFPKIYTRLRAWHGIHIHAIKIQDFELLAADRITNIIIGLLKIIHLFIVLLMIYFYIPFVLSLFPWTRGLSGKLVGYILSAFSSVGRIIVSYLPNLFIIAVVVLVTYYITKFVHFIFTEIGKGTIRFPGFYKDWSEPTYKLARFMLIILAIMMAYPYIPGSDSSAFKGVSIFIGIVFSLGSSSSIANIIAGIILTYMRAFSIGDRVKISDTIGDVIERSLLVTRIRTIKNVNITIPNSMILGSHIINFSSSADNGMSLILHTTVTIGYDVPWRRVHELLINSAKLSQNILTDPAPFVLQTSLDDFYVSYELNAYTDKPNIMAKTYSELHQNIQDKFNEAGVEIMSPHYSAIRDGNQITVPEDYLPETYTPPTFRISPLERLINMINGKAKSNEGKE
jgi:small-conductance mechanosensitive channel